MIANFIFKLITYSYYGFIVSWFYSHVLTPKPRITHPFLYCLLLQSCTCVGYLFYPRRSSLIMLLTMTLGLLLFSDSWSKRVLSGVILYFLIVFCEVSSVYLIDLIDYIRNGQLPLDTMGNSTDPVKLFTTMFLIILFSSVALYFCIPYLNRQFAFYKTKTIALIGVPIMIFFLSVDILYMFLDNSNFIAIFIVFFMLGAVNLCVLFIGTIHLSRDIQDYSELEKQKNYLENQLRCMKDLEDEYRRLRKWNHDIENHFLAISYLMEKEEYEECDQYVVNLLEKAKGSGTIN